MTQTQVKYRKDYRQSDHLIEHTELTFNLTETGTTVSAKLKLQRAAHAAEDAPLVLHGHNMTLQSIQLDGQPLSARAYQVNDNTLQLKRVPACFTLETTVEIHPEHNQSLKGMYRSGTMFCTQCEPHGFRKITYYLDRPDIMAKFTVKIIADKAKYPVMLSNGNKLDSGDLADGKHFVTWQDPFKKPSYLFALVAGDLAVLKDTFITCSGRDVALEIYSYPQDIDKCQYAMQSLKQAMQWDEKCFGREYDLDVYMIVTTPDFNVGAMENKGLNVFNTQYVLAKNETATDKDIENIQAVIGHEYFHNWTGNRVTCRDWFQLSLKEGLTVFRDQSFTADHHSHDIKRIEDAKIICAQQFAEDTSAMSHPIRPDSYIEMNNFYTSTVYNKGAEVIRMLHTLLGVAGFRKGMDLYFERHDGQAVTCDDFVNAMADANHKDFKLFKRWYSQSGTPILDITDEYNAKNKTYTVYIKQHTPATADQKDKLPLHIPIKTGLIDNNGQDIVERVLELTEEQQSFVFDHIAAHPTLSILRDFSAPVKINHNPTTTTQHLHLFAHDSNDFNRWQAGQTLATQLMLQPSLDDHELVKQFIKAVKSVLLNGTLDKALISEAVTMPSETTLAECMPIIKVDDLCQAHQQLIQQLAEALKDTWLSLYHQCHHDQAYDLSQRSIAERRLKGVCLFYLMQANNQDIGIDLATQLLKTADNMTDQLAAFSALLHAQDDNIRQQAITHFYQQWQGEDLVVNKWLMMQAKMPHDDALAHVKKLVDHPAFVITNPNKVYSLVGGFKRNFSQFHRADGAGYQFLKEMILKVDDFNPQVAASMTKGLASWRRFDATHQQQMQLVLQQLQQATLSKDTFEIVSKSLAG